jgi:hypothetical protein
MQNNTYTLNYEDYTDISMRNEKAGQEKIGAPPIQ